MLIQDLPFSDRYSTYIENNPAICDMGKSIRREMVRPLLRYQNEVGMRYTVTVNEIADTLEWKCLAHASSELLRDEHDSLRHFIREIDEVVDMCFGNYQAFTGRCWLQRHECSDDIVLVNEACGSLPCDDLAEDTTHEASGDEVIPLIDVPDTAFRNTRRQHGFAVYAIFDPFSITTPSTVSVFPAFAG